MIMRTKEEILSKETGLTLSSDMVMMLTPIENVLKAMDKYAKHYHKSKQKEINEDADRIVKKEINKLRQREEDLENAIITFLLRLDDGFIRVEDSDKGWFSSTAWNCIKDLRNII